MTLTVHRLIQLYSCGSRTITATLTTLLGAHTHTHTPYTPEEDISNAYICIQFHRHLANTEEKAIELASMTFRRTDKSSSPQ